MVRHFYLFLLSVVFWGQQLSSAPLKSSVSAEAAILVNADTGAILFEKNVMTPLYPASITKIATALYALQQKGDALDVQVIAQQEAIASISPSAKRKSNYKQPSYWIETGATHIGIKRGESMLLRDLLFATLIASANDASNVVAQHVGDGSIDNFMKGLNAYIKGLGCRDTTFVNPHGLHHPEHKTTAKDMAIIACRAMRNPLFREIVSSKNFVCPKTNKQPSRTLSQTNQLLKNGTYRYDKAIGIKTGYTSDAGHTLVAAAKQGDRTLIAVVMGCSERKEAYQDVTALFETAFSETKVKKNILKKGAQKHKLALNGGSTPLHTYLLEDIDFDYYPSEDTLVQTDIEWKNSLVVPIAKNSEVGTVKLMMSEGLVLLETPLYAANDVNPTLWHSLKTNLHAFSENSTLTKGSLLAGVVFITIGTFWWLKTRKKPV